MKLNIADRLCISALMPAENTYGDFLRKRWVLAKAALTDADAAKYSVMADGNAGGVKWDAEKDSSEPLDVEFTPLEADFLRRLAEGAEARGKAMPDWFWMSVEKLREGVA